MKVLPKSSSPESQYAPFAPSFHDVVSHDNVRPPADILEEHKVNLGLRELEKARYTSVDFHRRELDHMWSRVWQVACLEADIPEPGDVTTYEIGDESFIVARVTPTEIKAFYNSCLHRGQKLCSGTSYLTQIRCPFHGFTWNLDGSLKYVPCRWDFPQVSDESFNLREVKAGVWGGFVFINMDPGSVSLEEYLEVMPAHFNGFCDMDRKYVHARYRRILPCNWKTGIEAFMESYHSMETHPESLPLSAETNVQYDVYDKNTSRLMQTVGVQSTSLQTPLTEQQIAELVFEDMGAPSRQLLPSETVRNLLAKMVRDVATEEFGRDYSSCSEAELLDAVQYFLFPNIILFRGYSFPVGYRFRPNGHDPDTCIFDFMIFRELSEGQVPPAASEPIDMGERSFREAVMEMPESLRLIYDQDISNMRLQQKGLKVGGKKTVSLSAYQEIRIRHLHDTLDGYLEAAVKPA